MDRLSSYLRRIVCSVFLVEGFIALIAIVNGSSQHIKISAAACIGVLMFAAIGAAARFLPLREVPPSEVARVPLLLGGTLGLGLILRILWLIAVPPVQTSDYLRYLTAARTLLSAGEYAEYSRGILFRAFTPPGLPLFLAGGMKVLGDEAWTPALLNLLLYVGTTLVLFKLAERVAGSSAALFAVLIFAIWPSDIGLTGLAASEPLFLFLMVGGCYFSFVAEAVPTKYVALCGVAAGLAALVRPTALTLPALWLACALLYGRGSIQKLKEALVATACLILVIAPWTFRNYRTLHAFVPISTNGGDVFYRANNPLATGTWTARGERDLSAYMDNEVHWNQVGYAWGKEWIKSNPESFAKLAVRKQFLFFSTDETGTYWSLVRGFPERTTAGVASFTVSHAWWLLVWVLLLFSVLRNGKDLWRVPPLSCLLLPWLYFLGIHSTFESQARYHIPAVPFLLVIVSLGIAGYELKEPAPVRNAQREPSVA